MGNDLKRTTHLRQIAGDLASVYRREPGVRAVLLCGSVARGWADHWSDIELTICWERPPSEAVRTELANRLGVTGRRVYPDAREPRMQEEAFTHAGEKIDLTHTDVDGIAAVLQDVTVDCDPSPARHAFVAGVRDAVVLAGDDVALAWQRQATIYPEELQRTMIERNLVFGPHWWLTMLADRHDVLPLQDILVRIGKAVLGIVAALNRTCLPSDGFKWSQRVAAEMRIAPTAFPRRLEWILSKPPVEAVQEAGDLITDVFQLVSEHAPEIAFDAAIARFSSSRTT